MLYYIFNTEGQILTIEDHENAPSNGVAFAKNNLIKAKVNLETLEIYEGATAEEILAYEDNLVPTHINILDFRIQLIKIGIPIENIINTIKAIPDNVIPEINKKIILLKLEFATTINRKDSEFIAIANLMNITQEQIKTIFTNK